MSCHWSSSWLRSIQRQEWRLLLLRTVAELAQGHAELGGPALRVVGDFPVPDRVPARVPLQLAVAEHEVDLAPARREVELEARLLVVVADEADAHDVAGQVVASSGVAVDLLRVVVGADREVDVLVVIEDLELGGLRRRRPFDGHLLRVVARPLALPPGRVVQPPVDVWCGAFQADGPVDADRVLATERVGGAGGVFGGGSAREQEDGQQAPRGRAEYGHPHGKTTRRRYQAFCRLAAGRPAVNDANGDCRVAHAPAQPIRSQCRQRSRMRFVISCVLGGFSPRPSECSISWIR